MAHRVVAGLTGALLLAALATAAQPYEAVALVVVQDRIEQPLAAQAGDAARGLAIAADRQLGLCLLCHSAPVAQERFQGNLAPDLTGVGARLSPAQLRLRVANARHLNPQSTMPAFHVVGQQTRVGAAWQGKPILSAQQIEDVVAWLATLQ